MLMTDLTVPGFRLNAARDSGKHEDISIEEVRAAIDRHTIFAYLEEKLGRDYFSHLTPEQKYELNDHWESLGNVTTPDEFGVTKSGLSLLLAYLLEGIQNGTSRDGRLPEQRAR